MSTIDITGTIYTGMWRYDDPFPDYKLEPISQPDWVEYTVYMEEFKGMCSQTGTYLETPAHLLGYEKSYPLIDVPLDKVVDVETYVISLNYSELEKKDGRPFITKTAVLGKTDESKIKECKAVLVSTGWGKHWKDKNYVEGSPFFSYNAIEWLVSLGLDILGSDSPRWENLENPEGFFPMFYDADILMLAPTVNTEKISRERCLLTVLPLKIEKTCCTPCRALVKI